MGSIHIREKYYRRLQTRWLQWRMIVYWWWQRLCCSIKKYSEATVPLSTGQVRRTFDFVPVAYKLPYIWLIAIATKAINISVQYVVYCIQSLDVQVSIIYCQYTYVSTPNFPVMLCRNLNACCANCAHLLWYLC